MKVRTGNSARAYPPRPINFCAQCGEPIYIASWSEYVDDHRIRHVWDCDECGYAFETLVSYPPTQKAAR